jgi:hypothetical protein
MTRLFLSFVLPFVAVCAHARAVPSEADTHHLSLSLMLGGGGGNYGAGVEAGAALDLHMDFLIVGVLVSGAYGGGSEGLLALRLGHDVSLNEELSLDLFAEGGTRTAHAGGGIMREDPGWSVSELFVGLRVGLDYALNDRSDPVTFRLGFGLFGRMSLGSPETVSYEYESCFFSCHTESVTHEVGGVNDAGVTLDLSMDFGRW